MNRNRKTKKKKRNNRHRYVRVRWFEFKSEIPCDGNILLSSSLSPQKVSNQHSKQKIHAKIGFNGFIETTSLLLRFSFAPAANTNSVANKWPIILSAFALKINNIKTEVIISLRVARIVATFFLAIVVMAFARAVCVCMCDSVDWINIRFIFSFLIHFKWPGTASECIPFSLRFEERY